MGNPSRGRSTSDKTSKSSKSRLIILVVVLVVLAIAGFVLFGGSGDDTPAPAVGGDQSGSETNEAPVAGNDQAAPDGNTDAGSDSTTSPETPLGPPDPDAVTAPETEPVTGQDPASGSETPDEPAAAAVPVPGQYVVYQNQEQLDQLATSDRWLNFHAPWCPYCVSLDRDITENLSQIPPGVAIIKVDFDDNQDLRQQYDVIRQTTIVRIDANGQKVSSYDAQVNPSPTLANVITGLGL